MTTSLHKRRSRSETRKFEIPEKSCINRNSERVLEQNVHIIATKKQGVVHHNQYVPTAIAMDERSRGMGRRKTSAELISEAKTLLVKAVVPIAAAGNHAASVSGLRLVSTRRPITPREPGRALYGKVALAGRPPSAFSLRYLQNEGNRTPMTPSLEPIQSKGSLELSNSEQHLETQRLSRRSHSLDSRFEFYENDAGNNVAVAAKIKVPRKLPALEIKGVAIGGNTTNIKKVDDVIVGDAKSNNVVSNTRESMSATLNSRRTSCDSKKTINKSINVLTSRKVFTRNYDLLAQSSTEKLIELLKEHAGLKDCNDETVVHIYAILVELYARVSSQQKQFKRGFILGGLYGLVECSSPKILLAVARVVLALRVTGSNLTGACKLIFKVARNEQNDPLFHDNDLLELLIDGLGRASPLDDPEACIYGYGSVRFLTSSSMQERAETNAALKDVNKNWSDCLELPRKPATAPPLGSDMQQRERYQKLCKQNSLVERLARHGAVELMVLHLQMLNEAGATQQLQGPPLHSLYQLSAALRALADVRQTSCSFDLEHLANADIELDLKPISNSNIKLQLACPHLIRAAEISIGELEVQANIVRTLSVLSEDVDCCHEIVNFTARIGMLLGPCCENFNGGTSSEKLLSLLSRLGYILGNMMAKYDNARVQFYHNDVAMEYLLNVLTLYSKEPLTLHNHQGDTVIDVLIKMIRVVANMSVNSEVGFGLGNTRALGEILLNLLITTNETKNIKLKLEVHELTQATLGALHNLCFYQDKNSMPAQVIESKGSLQSVLNDLTMTLCVTLKTTSDKDTKVETIRVLGNITRNEHARKALCKTDGLSAIVRNLHKSSASAAGQPDYDLKACAIGVLVNLLGDWENRKPFMQLKGDLLLIELLRNELQQEDWFLAAITCQAYWNLLIDAPRIEHFFDLNSLDDTCDLLADYLDEQLIFDGCESTDTLWEEFAVVATDLLERLQTTYEQKQSVTSGESRYEPLDGSRNEKNNNVDNIDDNDDDEDDVYIDEL